MVGGRRLERPVCRISNTPHCDIDNGATVSPAGKIEDNVKRTGGRGQFFKNNPVHSSFSRMRLITRPPV